MRILWVLVFLAFFPGLGGADDDGVSRAGQQNPCDDPAIFSGRSARDSDVVDLADLMVPIREGLRLVWHCGTPDPPRPPAEALTGQQPYA